MAEVFDVTKFVLWCKKCFDSSRASILIFHNNIHPIGFNPLVFKRMPILPERNKELKLPKVDDYLTNLGGPKRLLSYFID